MLRISHSNELDLKPGMKIALYTFPVLWVGLLIISIIKLNRCVHEENSISERLMFMLVSIHFAQLPPNRYPGACLQRHKRRGLHIRVSFTFFVSSHYWLKVVCSWRRQGPGRQATMGERCSWRLQLWLRRDWWTAHWQRCKK